MESPTQTPRVIRLMREFGYGSVERFPSGVDLLAKVPAAPIELILAGKDLPDMSGSRRKSPWPSSGEDPKHSTP